MTVYVLTTLIALGSFAAGLLGSLTGLGGGIIVIPLLTLGFGVDIRYAIGASLVSVIATSSGAASAFVKQGFTNVRLGMLLEVGTTIGAIVGAMIAMWMPTNAIAVIFSLVLLFTAYRSFVNHQEEIPPTTSDSWSARFRVNATYPTQHGSQPYAVQSLRLGISMMFGAGIMSGLLGIGSGVFKVLAMDRAMRLPFKVSTTTSNFMIGITAAASAGVYFHRGYIAPGIAMPVMLGVVTGALLGARLLAHADTRILRRIFAIVVIAVAIQMLYRGATGGF